MLQVERTLYNHIQGYLKPGKVNIIYGARRVGKTSLMRRLSQELDLSFLWLDGELPETHDLLARKNLNTYKNLVDNYELIIIDEAQEIPDIGKALKIMVDNFPDENIIDTKRLLPERLIYGSYPEVYTMTGYPEKQRYLAELTNAYLLKDILNYDGIRNSAKIMDLLQLIAYQVGKEASLQELGRQIGMSKNTVEKYLDLLEKVYVIKKITGYSKNLRKEITKTHRYYFWDCGIRNAIINDYRPINARQDKGELWENYIITERLKKLDHMEDTARSYFWRTYDQQEIDCIETKDGQIAAYEIKYGNKTARIPKAFARAYPEASYEVINKENYLEFIT